MCTYIAAYSYKDMFTINLVEENTGNKCKENKSAGT